MSKNKKIDLHKFLVILFGVFILIITLIRFLSPEDTWTCQNGEWVKHGSPKGEKPDTTCSIK